MKDALASGALTQYQVVQRLDKLVSELFPDSEYFFSVGLTASESSMQKLDVDNIGILNIAARKGARPELVSEEFELRFSPHDVRVVSD